MSSLVTYTRAPHKLALVIETRRNPARRLSRGDHGDIARTPAKPETIKLRLQAKTRGPRIRNSSSLVQYNDPLTLCVHALQRIPDLVLRLVNVVRYLEPEPLLPWLPFMERGAGQLARYHPHRLSPARVQHRVITLVVNDENPVINAERQQPEHDKV